MEPFLFLTSAMKTIIAFKVLSIGGEGFHLMIKALINGKAAHLIVDTGASKTVFDKKRILKYVTEKKFTKHDKLSIGLGTGKIKSEFTTLKKLEMGDLKILDYTTILMDLSHVNVSYKDLGLKQIAGILGSDILLEYNAVINYEKKNLVLKYKKVKGIERR